MHEKFCIVCERPERLLVNDLNEPHCEDGPFCRWRDGVSLYAINGVYVPRWIVEHPERITVANIKRESNSEIRRIMRERYGDTKYFMDTKARIIDVDHQPVDSLAPRGEVIKRMLVEDNEKHRYLVASDGSTKRVYSMRVPDSTKTCKGAHEALTGKKESDCIGRS
jgi:hypothetical protein